MSRFVTFSIQISVSVIIVVLAAFLWTLLEAPRSWREWAVGITTLTATAAALYLIT